MPRPLAALVLAAALSAPCSALAGGIGHAGQADPASEGFQKTVSGIEPAPSPGDDGLDFWEIDSTSLMTNSFSYGRGQFDAEFLGVLQSPGGWVLSTTLRVLEVTGAGAGFGFGPSVRVGDTLGGGSDGGDSWDFSFVLNAGNPSQSTLSYANNVGQQSPLASVDVSVYHDYEFLFVPGGPGGADDEVEVRVDGALVGSVVRTLIQDQNLPGLRFGETNVTPGGSRSRWASLDFTPVPEPGRATLLIAGAAALLASGAPQRRPAGLTARGRRA